MSWTLIQLKIYGDGSRHSEIRRLPGGQWGQWLAIFIMKQDWDQIRQLLHSGHFPCSAPPPWQRAPCHRLVSGPPPGDSSPIPPDEFGPFSCMDVVKGSFYNDWVLLARPPVRPYTHAWRINNLLDIYVPSVTANNWNIRETQYTIWFIVGNN